MKKLTLDGTWQFRAIDHYHQSPETLRQASRWMPATVPGTVHTDLMANGVIPDPYVRMNENDVQWIDSLQWHYRRSFSVSPKLLKEEHIELVAGGLDTYASIRINGNVVGETSNMFIAHRFDLKRMLRPGKNTIEIFFDSPVMRSKLLEKRHGALRVALEPHRVYVRKAQYSFGWDWGPKLTTSGIWRSIAIEASSGGCLRDPFVRIHSLTKQRAIAEVSVGIDRPVSRQLQLRVFISGSGRVIERVVDVQEQEIRFRVEIPDPGLWWPNGYGGQPLYTMVLSLLDGRTECDEVQMNFACRTVKLLQEKDAEGQSFVLEVNGVPIYCKGMDWIPSDNFIPRIAAETYETLLTLARDSHANMLRVWGGGIYEQDIFYDLCDRLGLMVWQDFMYACGEYPDVAWFRKDAEREAVAVVKRLRNHPSIVLWCGNNECEWLFCTENPDRSPDEMRGATIFREILPRVCRSLDGTRPYWRSSPFGSGFPNAESNGNHHQWMVWSFWKDYPEYENDCARFVSEFGFQAPANRQTLEEVLPPGDRHPQSPAMEHHNKQVEGPERLYRFQAAHYKVGSEFDDFIYKGQLVQAEALKTAVEHWRRRKFSTAGSLIWQLNDCWPVSSWAVIDSALRPKASYYQLRRSFAPVLVSFRRAGELIEVWATNDRLSPVKSDCLIAIRTFEGRIKSQIRKIVRIPANRSMKIHTLTGIESDVERTEDYVSAELREGRKIVANNRFFFAEPKHLNLPAAHVSARWARRTDGTTIVRLFSRRFVKNVRLEIVGEDVIFSDNYFDIDGGSTIVVSFVSRLSPGELNLRFRMKWLT